MRDSLFILFLFICSCSLSQLPDNSDMKVGLPSFFNIGVNLNSGGWGVNSEIGKNITYKKHKFYSLEVLGQKHPKEYRILTLYSNSSTGFKYGKINNFSKLRIGIGRQYLIYEKLRSKGVDIFLKWNSGVSLGLVKPIYVNVAADSNEREEVRYDPNVHNQYNIVGRVSSLKGWGNISLVPGGFFKTAISFEHSSRRDIIKLIELGASIDVYPRHVPIMEYIDNNFIFFNMHITFAIGRKW